MEWVLTTFVVMVCLRLVKNALFGADDVEEVECTEDRPWNEPVGMKLFSDIEPPCMGGTSLNIADSRNLWTGWN